MGLAVDAMVRVVKTIGEPVGLFVVLVVPV